MRSSARVWIRRLAPWLVTGVVVAAIVREYSLEGIYDELRKADTLAILPFAVLLPLSHLVVQAIWDRWVLNRGTGGQLRYWDIVRGKAGSSVLLTLGFAFSSGGYALWVSRKTGASARTTIGTLLYIMMSGSIAIALLVTAAIWLGGAEQAGDSVSKLGVSPSVIGIAAPIAACTFILLTLLGPRLLAQVSDPQFFRPWQKIPPLLFIANLIGRSADISVIVIYSWLAARAFGLDIPFAAFFSFFPIVILIGSLPINIAGFGAVQVAWLVFEPWAPGERILAFQLAWHMSTGLAIVLRGLPFIRGVMRDIDQGRKQKTVPDAVDAID